MSADASYQATFVAIAPWVLFWQGTYWVTYLISPYLSSTFPTLDDKKGEKGYWASSAVSTVHALLITPFSAYVLWKESFLLESGNFVMATPLSLLACRIFLSYMVSDTFLCVYFGKRWPGWQANLAHHFMVFVTWGQMIAGGYGQAIAMLMHTMEFTTPLVNARWFLSTLGMKDSKIYLINGLTMVGSFGVFRIFGYLYAFTRLYYQWPGFMGLEMLNKAPFFLCFVAGFGLQCMWFQKMVVGAAKALSGGSRTKQKAPGGSDVDSSNIELTQRVSSTDPLKEH